MNPHMASRLLGPLWRRLRLLMTRGVVSLVRDTPKLQELQIKGIGDGTANAERFQQYGMTAHPHPGAEAIVASMGGSRAHLVVLAVDDRRHRPTGLEQGEVCLYTDEGDEIRLRRGRIVAITSGTRVEVTAPEATFSGNVQIAGELTVVGNITSTGGEVSDQVGSMSGMRGTYNGHNHPENDNGGPTGSPNQSMG